MKLSCGATINLNCVVYVGNKANKDGFYKLDIKRTFFLITEEEAVLIGDYLEWKSDHKLKKMRRKNE